MHNRHLRLQVSYPGCKCDDYIENFNQISWGVTLQKGMLYYQGKVSLAINREGRGGHR